jgi:NADH dehydrogenase
MPTLLNTRTRIADLGKPHFVMICGRSGFFAWLVWMFIHLVSIIGLKNKFFVLVNSPMHSFANDKSNRLIIARPEDGV